MFNTEIKVDGRYIKGTIKKDKNTFQFFSNLNIGDRQNVWTDETLDEIAEELRSVAEKIDSMNNPIYQV